MSIYRRLGFLTILMIAVFLSGCASDASDDVSKITQLVERYYDARMEQNDDDAIAVMYFGEGMDELKDRYTDFSASSLVQSYTVYDVQELTSELYAVNVVGVQVSPVEFVYGDDGEITGTKEPTDGRKWYVQSLDVTNYAAYIDGSWRFCVSSEVVPKELYDFSGEGKQEGTVLPVIGDDSP